MNVQSVSICLRFFSIDTVQNNTLNMMEKDCNPDREKNYLMYDVNFVELQKKSLVFKSSHIL
jgi:hypothetical protein